MTTQQQSYAEKFALLEPFHTLIFTDIKKELRDEHLRTDRGFYKRNFAPKELKALTVDDFMRVYPKYIADGFEELSDFIANRWLLRHLDIYNFYEARLQKYSQDFDKIQELEKPFAEQLLKDSVAAFGAKNSYIFAVLNSVAFPQDLFNELRSHATAA